MTEHHNDCRLLEEFNRLVSQIDEEPKKETDVTRALLERLDELIRKNKSVRESVDARFYQVALRTLQSLVSLEQDVAEKWSTISIVLKCTKNSAGVCRSNFIDSERLLSEFIYEQFLVGFRNELPFCLSNNHRLNTIIFSMQYIFNLIQGNKIAHETNIEKWSNVCFEILSTLDLKQELYDLASMILIYGCKEKPTNNSLDLLKAEPNLSRVTLDVYFNLLDRLFLILREKDLDFDDLDEHGHLHLWTFKFIEFYYEHSIFDRLVQSGADSLVHHRSITRANFASLLNFKVTGVASSVDENVRRYLTSPSLEFFEKFLQESSEKLVEKVKAGDEDTESDLQERWRETKFLVNSLAYLLTYQEGLLPENEIKSNLQTIQNNEVLFVSVCELLRLLYDRKFELAETKREDKRTESIGIKCELVRLIGILVYENEKNQIKMAENGLMQLLSANLKIDVENPFFREWAIVALRHVLCAHDIK